MDTTASETTHPLLKLLIVLSLTILAFLCGLLVSEYRNSRTKTLPAPVRNQLTQVSEVQPLPIDPTSDIVKNSTIFYSLYGRVDTSSVILVQGVEQYRLRLISFRGEKLPVELSINPQDVVLSGLHDGKEVPAVWTDLKKDAVVRIDYNVDPKNNFQGQVVKVVIEK